jgi:arabinoxylan arabinofuranohydrolase
VLYHRATHNSVKMRKACVEPIAFNPDGSIPEVEMTTQGAGPPLKATLRIDAERACLLYGNTRIQAFASSREELGEIRDGDFGSGVDSVMIRVSPGRNPGKIQLKMENSWGPNFGTVEIPGDSDPSWQTITAKLDDVKGVKALWLRFTGEGEDLFSIDWIRFE